MFLGFWSNHTGSANIANKITIVSSLEEGRMEAKSEKETKQKKPYVKPKVVKVQLTPEEVVLGACKSAGGHGAGVVCRLCGTVFGS